MTTEEALLYSDLTLSMMAVHRQPAISPVNPLFLLYKEKHSHVNLSYYLGLAESERDTSLKLAQLHAVVVQSLSCVWLFATPWTAAHQASLSISSSWSLLRLMSIESVMPSSHLAICHPFLLLPSIFPSIRVFSKVSALHITPSNEYS